MVMSCGWNPFYKNEKLSAETHIIHTFPNEFYGVELRVLIAGYIRPEWNFKHVKHLIKAIKVLPKMIWSSIRRTFEHE